MITAPTAAPEQATACPLSIEIVDRHTLNGIQAVSGLTYLAPYLYWVSDTETFVIRSSLDFASWETIALLGENPLSLLQRLSSRVEGDGVQYNAKVKRTKPDFECMTPAVKDACKGLLVLGSGTTAQRMRGVWLDLNTQEAQVVMNEQDYQSLIDNRAFTGGEEFNVEAACTVGDDLYFFQRGHINRHHGIMRLSQRLLFEQGAAAAVQETFTIDTPQLSGYASGISDACTLPDGSAIMLTASVEATSNAIDDGPVLGSFVGCLPIGPDGRLAIEKIQWAALTDEHGSIIPIKVEGITWLRTQGNRFVFLLATDSDGHDSEFLTVHCRR